MTLQMTWLHFVLVVINGNVGLFSFGSSFSYVIVPNDFDGLEHDGVNDVLHDLVVEHVHVLVARGAREILWTYTTMEIHIGH